MEETKKNRIVAGLLGIFLGTFGVHNFYIGKTKRGVAQLSLTFVGLGLMLLLSGFAFIIGIIGTFASGFMGGHMYGDYGMSFSYSSHSISPIFMLFTSSLIMLLSILPIVAAIWGFIEGVLILVGSITKDGKGHDLENLVPEGQKSRMAAGILGVTLGLLGVHNFYLGRTSRGVVQLLLTIIGWCFLFIGPIAAFIWAFIESIQLFTGKVTKDGKDQDLYLD